MNDEFMTLLKTIFEYLGYFTVIASIFSLCVKIYTQKKIINSLSEKWQEHIKGDYIFLLGECNNHSGEIIFGILHEIYPIATTEKMTGVFTGLSYESRLPHTTEFYFSKNKPNLTELNNDLYKLKIQTKQFLWNDVFKTD